MAKRERKGDAAGQEITRTAAHVGEDWKGDKRGPWGTMPDPAPTAEPVDHLAKLRRAMKRKPRVE